MFTVVGGSWGLMPCQDTKIQTDVIVVEEGQPPDKSVLNGGESCEADGKLPFRVGARHRQWCMMVQTTVSHRRAWREVGQPLCGAATGAGRDCCVSQRNLGPDEVTGVKSLEQSSAGVPGLLPGGKLVMKCLLVQPLLIVAISPRCNSNVVATDTGEDLSRVCSIFFDDFRKKKKR
ncbi:hypothetical protein RRG08_010397 [Elysia crispata]|uniref:Uncharacterized protein n=1 Tax=Elysia crispata TaxID=231223 RepID=A0AAE1BC55_9GAST|nr:hypothetical protein RRG08_010397 [Elysia crispata]